MGFQLRDIAKVTNVNNLGITQTFIENRYPNKKYYDDNKIGKEIKMLDKEVYMIRSKLENKRFVLISFKI